MKAESLKEIRTHLSDRTPPFSGYTVACLQNFFGEKVRVDDANHAALLVHDWECEKFVEHKKFAGVKNRCAGRNSHHAWNHDLAQRCFQRCRQQTACRNDANQPFLFVDRIKINDAFTHAFTPDALQRFTYRHARAEQRKILARVIDYRRIKIGNRGGDVHRFTR